MYCLVLVAFIHHRRIHIKETLCIIECEGNKRGGRSKRKRKKRSRWKRRRKRRRRESFAPAVVVNKEHS